MVLPTRWTQREAGAGRSTSTLMHVVCEVANCHQPVIRAKMHLSFLRNTKKKLAGTMKKKEVEKRLVICSSIDRNLRGDMVRAHPLKTVKELNTGARGDGAVKFYIHFTWQCTAWLRSRMPQSIRHTPFE